MNTRIYVHRIDGVDAVGIWVYDSVTGAILKSDGSWEQREALSKTDPSFVLPGVIAKEIVAAVAEYHLERSLDPRTESKVLREVLTKEQARVDHALGPR